MRPEKQRLLYDVTPAVTEQLQVWPGDTPPSREVLCDMKAGDNLTLSTLRATVHLGAHADGPNHYDLDGAAIDQRSVDYYLGQCQVCHVRIGRGRRVRPKALPDRIEAPRVLIATGTFPDPEEFNQDFAALAPELVDDLYAKGVKLIGIDTPSVDLFDSKDLPTHARFAAQDMAILEGLVLHDVPEGRYELIALPLKLVGFDASPVRAVLRTI
ncbi:MAG: cyclase family protein [Planctomycetota bacterium]